MLRTLFVCGFFWASWTTNFLTPEICIAGGGPENVLLVVNVNSEASKTVANYYIDLRKIPPTNVFYLNFPAGRVSIPSNIFEKLILSPIFKEIEKRKLSKQIDCVVYSCDFPWRVDFKKQFASENLGRSFTPMCSLTSATYLYAFVQQHRKEMFGLNANFYAAPFDPLVVVSRAFRANYRWSLGGKRAGQEGLPYMMSAMLGVNTVPGNTVDEIAWYLQRAVPADGSAPGGTIYFAANKTIRSKVRDQDFPAAVRLIQLTGVRAQIVQEFFPQNRPDMAGVTCGHSNVNPAGSGSRFLPGAFCDNLTSSGGQFLPDKRQTVISEFLRIGAAGACGTVIEPTAIPQKFPNASLHVHYVHGCSLAESFYQAVASPFQQILVGDPLCQPWAKIPKVTVTGITEGEFAKGVVEIVPTSTGTQQPVASFQLFVDGNLQQQIFPGERFKLDTTKMADGYHEVRVVGTDNTPIETQGRWIGSLNVKNGRDAIQLSLASGTELPILNFRLSATHPTATSIVWNGVEVAKVPSGEGPFTIEKSKLGAGPVTLMAVAKGENGLRSQPLRVVIGE
jgi:hypothetical protein